MSLTARSRPRAAMMIGIAMSALVAAMLALPGNSAGEPAPAPANMAVVAGGTMFPTFAPQTQRYAVRAALDGSVSVVVSGAELVWFNGVRDDDGTLRVPDAAPGSEIAVFIQDSTGRHVHALYVLPPDFPILAASRNDGTDAAGLVALTLNQFDPARPTSPKFEVLLDRNGVPVWTHSSTTRSMDLKQATNGRLSVHRVEENQPGRTGGSVVELDSTHSPVQRFTTRDLVHTDGHDSILLPNGEQWLLAYEPNRQTGRTDAVIQHLDAAGQVLFSWTSEPYVAETAGPPGAADYAHVNSIDLTQDGDVIASFRQLSSIYRIATHARPGTDVGDVVWKLGGRDSTFTFPPGDNGPCAQHSATVLPSGNVLVFDNGSTPFFGNLCIDQSAPQSPATPRESTRVVEFALDTATNSATVVRTYGQSDRFAWFMGSARALESGNVLIGWSADSRSMATETRPDGSVVWDLADARVPIDGATPRAFFSYRAALVQLSDAIAPQVHLNAPPDGAVLATGDTVPVAFSCSDVGGSTLSMCTGPEGGALDTSTLGTHTWQVVAQDGAGNSTRQMRTYTVTAAPTAPPSAPSPPAPTATPTLTPPFSGGPRPDLAVSIAGGSWVGADMYAPQSQTSVLALRRGRTMREMRVRLTNTGTEPGRFRVRAPTSLGRGAVRLGYRSSGKARTGAIFRGWRTPVLEPGASLRLWVRVTVRRTSFATWSLPLRVKGGGTRDRVAVTIRR